MNAASISVNDVPAIVGEFRRLREEAIDGVKATAATMNFIVYVDSAEHRNWAVERALGVADKHPARLLVLDASDLSERATVYHAVREQEAGTFHCERAELAVGAIAPSKLCAMVHVLGITDIPTVVWWTGEQIAGTPVFAALAELATILVVDSSGRASDTATIREVTALVGQRTRYSLRDLAYLRLTPWQEVVAQCFDETAFREALASLERVEIAAGSEAEALYLAGWLGSRLGWTAAGRTLFHTRGGSNVELAVDVSGEKRRVRKVTLTSAGTRFIAELSGTGDALSLTVEGGWERAPRYTPLQSIDNLTLIERAILNPGPDAIFETSLRMVRDVLG